MTRLNIGCGYDVRPGWINADLVPVDPRVVQVDASSHGWPWPDERFERVEAIDLIEHLERPMAFLAECWRVLTPGGTLLVRGPHFTSRSVATDLTHRRGLSSAAVLGGI